jgi:hypothetical protein
VRFERFIFVVIFSPRRSQGENGMMKTSLLLKRVTPKMHKNGFVQPMTKDQYQLVGKGDLS